LGEQWNERESGEEGRENKKERRFDIGRESGEQQASRRDDLPATLPP
jgi:hypothetical protein